MRIEGLLNTVNSGLIVFIAMLLIIGVTLVVIAVMLAGRQSQMTITPVQTSEQPRLGFEGPLDETHDDDVSPIVRRRVPKPKDQDDWEG